MAEGERHVILVSEIVLVKGEAEPYELRYAVKKYIDRYLFDIADMYLPTFR